MRNEHGIWAGNENVNRRSGGLEEDCLRSKVSGRRMRKVVGLEGEGALRRELEGKGAGSLKVKEHAPLLLLYCSDPCYLQVAGV